VRRRVRRCPLPLLAGLDRAATTGSGDDRQRFYRPFVARPLSWSNDVSALGVCRGYAARCLGGDLLIGRYRLVANGVRRRVARPARGRAAMAVRAGPMCLGSRLRRHARRRDVSAR